MKKTKIKYNIYRESILDYGDGHIDRTTQRIGSTYAVSEKQAINNYRYRTKERDQRQYWAGGGGRYTYLIARADVSVMEYA